MHKNDIPLAAIQQVVAPETTDNPHGNTGAGAHTLRVVAGTDAGSARPMPNDPANIIHLQGWELADAFLNHIYTPAGAKDVWVTGFADIGSASWHGGAGLDHLQRRVPDPDKADLYFCIGQLEPGASRRAIGNVVAQPLLIADDIGTKVDPIQWEARIAVGMARPSFRIETSPGNETWGWILKGDPRTPKRFEEMSLVRAHMVDKGLTDNVMDETRYIRLPLGWNSKPKYRPAGAGLDQSPPVRLVEWNPEPVSLGDVAQFVVPGGVNWRQATMPTCGMTGTQLSAAVGNGTLRRTADMNKPEPIIRMAEAVGLAPQNSTRAGVVDAICPFSHEHSDRADTGFAFIGDGLCQCMHASCASRRTPDFHHRIEEMYDDLVSGMQALGLPLGDMLTSGRLFMARASFEQHGVTFDADAEGPGSVAATQADADALAGRMAQHDADVAQAAGSGGRPGSLPVAAAEHILSTGARAFVDTRGTVWLRYDGGLLNVSQQDPGLFRLARSKGFRLTGAQRAAFAEALADSVDPDAAPVEVSFRAATDDTGPEPRIFVNLMSGSEAVEITSGGWEIAPLSSLPVYMANRPGGLPMVKPDPTATAADLWLLLERHFPLAQLAAGASPGDRAVRQRAVILALLSSAYWRRGTVPHLMIDGPKGSGKTTTAGRLSDMTDPDAAGIVPSLPKDPAGLFAAVGGLTVAGLDNASGITGGASDAYCALANGTKVAVRELYTTGRRSILQGKCSLIFTSVLPDIIRRADLAERTLRFETDPIGPAQRRGEREMGRAWRDDLPRLYGALFSALAAMLANLPDVEAELAAGKLQAPRLHDAAAAAEAMARGLGWAPGLCMAALMDNANDEAARLLEDNPVAVRIRRLLETCPNGEWSGTYAELEGAVGNVTPADPADVMPVWDRHRLPFKGQYQRLWPDMDTAWGIERIAVKRNGQRGVTLRVRRASAP